MATKYLGSDDPRGNYDDVIYMKMITKKDENPRFTLKVKEGNEYVELPDTPNSVSGTLKNVEFGVYEWEKQKIKTVKFIIEKTVDGIKQLYILSSSFTSTLRTILNSMLNVNEPINTLTIALIKNKAGYNGAYTVFNGKKGEWKYQQDFLKTMIETEKTKKGEIVYYDKLDQFLEDEMMKHLSTIIPGSLIITDKTEDRTDEDTTLDELFGPENN